jgi:hypothetical protein
MPDEGARRLARLQLVEDLKVVARRLEIAGLRA